MNLLAISLLLAQLADVIMTWACLARGGVELNPALSPWLGTPASFAVLLSLKVAWVMVALLGIAIGEAKLGRRLRWARGALWVVVAWCWAVVGWGAWQLLAA